MFCKNCGQAMPDNTKFCAACGTAVEGAAPGQLPPILNNVLARILGFFAKPLKTIGAAAKSNTHEWSILMGINVLLYAVFCGLQGLVVAGKHFDFFPYFGITLLIAAVFYFGTSLGLWLLTTQVFKKQQVSFMQTFNMVAVACLPLTAASLINILMGAIYVNFMVVFEMTALIMTVVSLFVGVRKLGDLEEDSFYGYSIVMGAMMLICALLTLLY